ncbi:hypothetical protein H7B90_01995 [Cohnella xylanilytica]|uniref:DUF4825 domain-containing protein n=1 Tax=Cohnella xylanilytica TaxID=557555 RepID=A0A841TTF6_9BACL|nr:hypothetical protein [Cohnella xylanilytica]MBB6690162.1 hypothetical protein [Cohnella xylanilytica]
MTFDRRWAYLLAASFAVVVLLGQLPRLDRWTEERRESARAAFTPQRVEALSDDVLVDALISLPLEPRLSRVSWNHDILSVDLKIAPGTDPERTFWMDAAELVRLAYGTSSNVRGLLIRVFEEEDGKRRLLLAADTRASDWPDFREEDLRRARLGLEPEWDGKLRLSWTAAGERARRNFAKS